jgi:hypothetical protein
LIDFAQGDYLNKEEEKSVYSFARK